MNDKQPISEEQLLNLYAEGIRDFRPYIINFVVPEAMNLSGVDFRGQDLCECDISGMNLSGANLQEVGFAQSDLSRADLSGANLTSANFSEAFLSETNLTDAKLTNAFFDNGTQLLGCNLTRTDFRGATLDGVVAKGNIYDRTIMPDGTI